MPNCHQRIKAVALKCRFCGTLFETRDYVSQDDFAKREYRDREYTFARNALVLLFLLSITGCLSPVALILHLILRYGGRLGSKLEFNRFPDELKALNLIGLVMSGGLVALGFLALLLQASQSI